MTTVRITERSEGNQRELIVTSAYLSYDSDKYPPTKEMRDAIDYCNRRGKQVTGCDANVHHILRGSNDINPRRESEVEYLVSSNFTILLHV